MQSSSSPVPPSAGAASPSIPLWRRIAAYQIGIIPLPLYLVGLA